MTPQERKNLAEQITSNPLYTEVFDTLEKQAIDACVNTKDPTERADMAAEVRVIRSFRRKCHSAMNTAPARIGAVA